MKIFTTAGRALYDLLKVVATFIWEVFQRIFSMFKNFLKWLIFDDEDGFWGTVKALFFAFIIAMVLRTFLYEPFHIPSSSMKPTLLEGDYIFVSKYSYGYSRYSLPFGPPIFKGRILGKEPKRGDVIVFKLPSDTRVSYVKRLIGLPGDKIQMASGVLYLNGVAVPKEYTKIFHDDKTGEKIKEYTETIGDHTYHVLDDFPNSIGDNTEAFTVPENHFFFLGDNRDNSLDSRFIEGAGMVPRDNLVGRANIIFISSKENPLKFWTWHRAIRGGRFLKTIK